MVIMNRQIEIVQPFAGTTKVLFWKGLKKGDILEFQRGSTKWHTTILLNLATKEYAPDNRWTQYMTHIDSKHIDPKQALFVYRDGGKWGPK